MNMSIKNVTENRGASADQELERGYLDSLRDNQGPCSKTSSWTGQRKEPERD